MRNGWFPWLNFFCLIAVFHGHVISEESSTLLNCVLQLVIPFFVLMAGFSWGGVLRKTKGAGALYGLQLFLWPYLFWSLSYFVLNNIVLDVVFRHQYFSITVQEILSAFFLGGAAVHTWFLISLIYAASVYAVVYRVRSRICCLFAILLSFVSLLIPVLGVLPENVVGHFLQFYFLRFMLGFSVGFFLSTLQKDIFTKLIVRCGVIPVMAVVGVMILCFWNLKGFEIFFATALFMGMLSFPKMYCPEWLAKASSCTMGIYLVHFLFTSGVNIGLGLSHERPMSAVLSWFVCGILFFVCWAFVWVLRRLPIMAIFV